MSFLVISLYVQYPAKCATTSLKEPKSSCRLEQKKFLQPKQGVPGLPKCGMRVFINAFFCIKLTHACHFLTCEQVHNSEENLHVVGLVKFLCRLFPWGLEPSNFPEDTKSIPTPPPRHYSLTNFAGLWQKSHFSSTAA